MTVTGLNGERAAEAGVLAGSGAPATAPAAPEFAVLGASVVEDAAAPTLRFELDVSESSGRDVFTIALSAQIQIDPARRSYDPETRARLVELFGEPERWASTTHSFLWAHASTLVPSFSGRTTFSLPLACTYDLELAACKYFYSLPGGHVPLSFHFNGAILYRRGDGQVEVAAIPWSCSASWRLPVETWRRMIERHYPNSSWVRLHPDTTALLRIYRARAGLLSIDAAVCALLEQAGLAEPGGA